MFVKEDAEFLISVSVQIKISLDIENSDSIALGGYPSRILH